MINAITMLHYAKKNDITKKNIKNILFIKNIFPAYPAGKFNFSVTLEASSRVTYSKYVMQ